MTFWRLLSGIVRRVSTSFAVPATSVLPHHRKLPTFERTTGSIVPAAGFQPDSRISRSRIGCRVTVPMIGTVSDRPADPRIPRHSDPFVGSSRWEKSQDFNTESHGVSTRMTRSSTESDCELPSHASTRTPSVHSVCLLRATPC